MFDFKYSRRILCKTSILFLVAESAWWETWCSTVATIALPDTEEAGRTFSTADVASIFALALFDGFLRLATQRVWRSFELDIRANGKDLKTESEL